MNSSLPDTTTKLPVTDATTVSQAAADPRLKTLMLTDEKIRQLMGYHGRNKAFIEAEFNLAIRIARHSLKLTEKEAAAEQQVQLVAQGSNDFSDKLWAKNVYRYVKSATRGGFLKWLENSEENSALLRCPELFERVESRFSVKVVNHWRKDASLWAVLENDGCIPGKLEQAIAEAGQVMHNRFDSIRRAMAKGAGGR